MKSIKELFIFEMWQQGITTLESLFDSITEKERVVLIEAITSKEYQNEYKRFKRTGNIKNL